MGDSLSEGAADAPSNGSSAPTSAAPGVSTPTATPKSGEGAVVPSGEAGESNVTAPPKPAWAYKGKLKLGETEEDVELDEDTLKRRLVAAKAADKYSKEAKQLAREKAEREARKQRGEILEDDAAKEAWFQKRLQEEARRLEMPEAERQKEDAERRIAAIEARARAAEQRARQLEYAQAEEAEWKQLGPQLEAGMKAHGMIGDTFAMDSISQVAQEFLDAKLDVPVDVVLKEAAERDAKKWDERLGKLTPELAPQVWKKLPAEVRKAFGFMAAEDYRRSKSNIPAPAAPVPTQSAPERREESAPMTPDRWLRKLGR